MKKEEILEKSRAENKNKDIYEQEVLKQASTSSIVVMLIIAAFFCVAEVVVSGDVNWGMWALVLSVNMTTSWVKYIKLRRKHELMFAIAYTILVFAFAGYHIYNLIALSTIL